jgi:hypothetical protein
MTDSRTMWSLSAEWLADMAATLGHVRDEDGAPTLLTPELLLERVRDIASNNDYHRRIARAYQETAESRADDIRQLVAALSEVRALCLRVAVAYEFTGKCPVSTDSSASNPTGCRGARTYPHPIPSPAAPGDSER